MRAIAARLFLLLPGWWMYFFDNRDDIVELWTPGGMIIASIIWFSILTAWDQTRRPPRSPISVMLARLLVAAWVISFVVLWVFPTESPYRFSLILATILVTGYITISLTIHLFGHFFVYPTDENYYHVRRAGWHPFWDRLWPIFNPDSELIRDGGFEEPEYTDFIPSSDYRFQCPQCGARVPDSFGVCWRCGYGGVLNSVGLDNEEQWRVGTADFE